MWYVLKCRAGQEERLIRSCRQHLSAQAVTDVFQFSSERMKKYLGAWHLDTCRLFPGYIFLESGDPKQLWTELREYQEITEILEQDGLLLPVSREEQAYLQALCGKSHVLGVSRGVIRDGRFVARQGPLQGRETWIRRLDLHHRVAVLKGENFRMKAEKQQLSGSIWAGIFLEEETHSF